MLGSEPARVIALMLLVPPLDLPARMVRRRQAVARTPPPVWVRGTADGPMASYLTMTEGLAA